MKSFVLGFVERDVGAAAVEDDLIVSRIAIAIIGADSGNGTALTTISSSLR
jgi:Flp pilus assembly pilin Flp